MEILERFVLNVFWIFVLLFLGGRCSEFLVAPKMACLFLKVEKFAQKESLGSFFQQGIWGDSTPCAGAGRFHNGEFRPEPHGKACGRWVSARCLMFFWEIKESWRKRNTISAWPKFRWSAKRNVRCSWYSSGPTCAVQWSSQICMKPIVSGHVS